MKKTIASTIFVLAFGLYALSQTSGIASSSYTVTNTSSGSTQTTSSNAASSATIPAGSAPVSTLPTAPVETPTPVSAPKPKGQYTDGTYTGSVADAYYGNVQVRATISGGKIVDVQFLQYPNDRGTSREINAQAIPLLKTEALRVQSANVNGVSGASDTSAAFRESLTVALAQAKA